MIDVTVKTLDSQNHTYSVADDITVKHFKEIIATSVAIPADKQRLIYCGRVLQDDRKLSEYDVNGKVIHLVQRAPPAASRPQPAPSQVPRQQTPGARNANSFLLGAFTIPSDVMDPNQQIVQQVVSGMGELGRNATVMSRTSDDGLSVDVHINLGHVPGHSESQQRINQAQTMLRLANQSLDRLENPSAAAQQGQDASVRTAGDGMDTTNSSSAQQTPEAPQMTSAEPFNVGQESGSFPVIRLVQAAQAVADLAAAAAVPQATAAAAPQAAAAAATRESLGSGSTGSAPSSTTGSERVTPQQEATTSTPPTAQQDNAASQGNRPNVTPRTPIVPRPTRPAALATLLERVASFDNRFQPHLAEYQRILREDPDFNGTEQRRSEAQQTFNCVSEVLHYLSHCYHAISDIMIDLSQPPPRSLRARPLLMQHHAAMMTPVQAQINVSTMMSHNYAAQQPAQQQQQVPPPVTTSNGNGPQPQPAQPEPPGTPAQGPARGNVPVSMAELFASRNPIVFMEVGPGSITIDSISTTTVGDTNQANQSRFPMLLSQPPPQDFIQNLMQAVGQATTQRAGNNGQSQARGNTATQPTTATQTRSTPRSIQTVPLAIPGLNLNSFDPYLPCSSRHLVQGNSRRAASAPASSTSRSGNSQEAGTQGGPAGGSTSDTQLGAMVATVMLSLLGQGGLAAPTVTVRAQPPPPPFSGTVPDARTQVPTSVPTQPEAPASVSASQLPLSDPMISQVFQAFLSSQASGAEGQPTVANFLRTVSNPPYQEGEGLLADLVMCIASQLSFRDLMNVFSGSTEPWQRLRVTLRNFLQENFLRGLEPTEGNISAAFERQINVFWDEEFTQIPDTVRVREGVDYVGTIRNFLRQKLSALIAFIMNSSEENFGTEFHTRCQADIAEFVALAIHCFQDGQQGLEQVSQHRLRQADLAPAVHQWLSTMCTVQIRTMVSNIQVSEAQISRYVIPVVAPRSANGPSPVMDEVSLEADSVPEPMDIGSSPDSERMVTPDEISEGTSVRGNLAPETNVATTVTKDEEQNWRRDVDDEWVPVISQDIQRQRRQNAQRPLSDAYISIMPSKRRKMMCGSKGPVASDPKNSLTDTLNQAILDLGVQPMTSMEQVSNEASACLPLQEAYRQHLHSTVRRRLNGDRDFSQQKFPKSQEYFLGGKTGNGYK